MARLVVLVLLVVLAVWLVRRALRPPQAKQASTPKAPGPADELVRCARCGLHLPRAAATAREGQLFCGEEHAGLGRLS